jgi:hypothetical protein
MRIDFVKKATGVAIVIMLCGLPALSVAQDKPADNMEILRDKILAGVRGVSKGFTKDQSTASQPFG